jgi:hypothetical protein
VGLTASFHAAEKTKSLPLPYSFLMFEQVLRASVEHCHLEGYISTTNPSGRAV